MAWTTAISDLRKRINDGPQDKLRYFQRCIGRLNGTNKLFKTFEYRRVTNFLTAALPEGIYLNQVPIPTSGVVTDNVVIGEFQLANAPSDGDVLEATFFIQWFLDDELQEFLSTASQWLGFSTDFTVIPDGLQPAALKYATAEAFDRQGQRMSEYMHDVYRLEDKPDPKAVSKITEYKDKAEALVKEAGIARKSFYDHRQDQAYAPLYGSILGNVRNVTSWK